MNKFSKSDIMFATALFMSVIFLFAVVFVGR